MNDQEFVFLIGCAFAAVGGFLGGIVAESYRRREWIAPSWARVIAFRSNALGLDGRRLVEFSATDDRPGEPRITLRDAGGTEHAAWMPQHVIRAMQRAGGAS